MIFASFHLLLNDDALNIMGLETFLSFIVKLHRNVNQTTFFYCNPQYFSRLRKCLFFGRSAFLDQETVCFFSQ